jgi:uncharacterized protein (DUF427 family)
MFHGGLLCSATEGKRPIRSTCSAVKCLKCLQFLNGLSSFRRHRGSVGGGALCLYRNEVDAAMKSPGPDHPITIAPNPQRVRVTFGGVVIADSTRALTLRESTYKPVLYVPRADVRMDMLTRTAHSTRCPYKGAASYYTAQAGERVGNNVAWSYEDPYPAVAPIAGHLAFYPDRVDSIEQA